ncbi:hypothetical protein [Ramlibacter sp. PS4R-6]|uniref:hypothetical protein n=1 Tax=Ramlibacter sp. PS4R-6 TaxID=3133438 RepID=UPI0030959362
MPTALDLAKGDAALQDAVRRCRKLLNRRALVAAAASAVPIPGLDWAVDAALISRVIPVINEEFGLTPQQIDALPDTKREQVQKAMAMVGSVVIGRLVTRDLVVRMAKVVGKRLTVQQAAKYVPIAGQAVSAVMGYTALRYLGEEHIKDCVRVVRQAQLALPAPKGVRRPSALRSGRSSQPSRAA